MGQTTQYLGIYIPAAGESNYDQAFSQGMFNIDNHDHTGGPNKGKPITTTALGDGSVTYAKLNTNVADATTGIQAGAGALANQLQLIGILPNIFTLGNAAATGFIVKNSAGVTAVVRTITGTTNQIAVTNGDGAAGNPNMALSPIVLNTTQPSFCAKKLNGQVLALGDNNIGFSVITGDKNFVQGGAYTPSVFTAPVDGVYTFSSSLGINVITGSGEIFVKLSINGGAVEYILANYHITDIAAVGNSILLNGTAIVKLAATDTVRVVVNNAVVATLEAYADSYFCGALLY